MLRALWCATKGTLVEVWPGVVLTCVLGAGVAAFIEFCRYVVR